MIPSAGAKKARHRRPTAHERARYRCFLPDLAGLAGKRRAGPMPDIQYYQETGRGWNVARDWAWAPGSRQNHSTHEVVLKAWSPELRTWFPEPHFMKRRPTLELLDSD